VMMELAEATGELADGIIGIGHDGDRFGPR
jgi:hypothetical protein